MSDYPTFSNYIGGQPGVGTGPEQTVINPATGLARQVILSLSGYSARQVLDVVAAQPPVNEVSHARADATA